MRSTFWSQNAGSGSEPFWTLRCRKRARRCGAKHISKSKVLKTDRLGTLTRDISIRHVKVKPLISWEGLLFGASDLQVCLDDFAWQVQHFLWPGLTFAWSAQYFRQMGEQIAKRIGTRLSGLHSACHFWRKSHRLASFLMLPSFNFNIEEVSQNFLVLELWTSIFPGYHHCFLSDYVNR